MFILEDIESPMSRKGKGAKRVSIYPEEMVQAFNMVPNGSSKNS